MYVLYGLSTSFMLLIFSFQVNEFLTGAGTDAPDVEEENITSRPSVTYEDMWAKTILETYEAEVQIEWSFQVLVTDRHS